MTVQAGQLTDAAQTSPELPSRLGLPSATALVIGSIIGTVGELVTVS